MSSRIDPNQKYPFEFTFQEGCDLMVCVCLGMAIGGSDTIEKFYPLAVIIINTIRQLEGEPPMTDIEAFETLAKMRAGYEEMLRQRLDPNGF